jgi:hypothetical protein
MNFKIHIQGRYSDEITFSSEFSFSSKHLRDGFLIGLKQFISMYDVLPIFEDACELALSLDGLDEYVLVTTSEEVSIEP